MNSGDGAWMLAATAIVTTFVIRKVVDLILGIRISPRQQELAIDLSVHGDIASQA